MYHGWLLTIIWDKKGDHYKMGIGMSVMIDGQAISNTPDLRRLELILPLN